MFKQQRAFTLIELMVVMAIMTVIFALVGPLAQNQVDKVKASEEWYEFSQQVQILFVDAYLKGDVFAFELDNNTMTVYSIDSTNQVLSYDYLVFEYQKVHINVNGFSDKSIIYARSRGIPKELRLMPMLNEAQRRR